jgi:tRNA threonylcarbamoyladenosine biosynthesis protein TsaB
MAILAFDSCLRAISAAVRVEGRTTARLDICDTGHAERLLPLVQAVMAEAGVAFAALTRLAVTLGPGGFTGLRVGLSAARGIALATGIPTVGVSSLQAMAWRACADLAAATPAYTHILVAVPAGRGAVFAQSFTLATAVPDGPALYVQVSDSGAFTLDARTALVGPGGPELAAIVDPMRQCAQLLPGLQPSAADLVARASALTPVAELRPIYLRPADAKLPASNALLRAP